MFADKYLLKKNISPLISQKPSDDLNIIVVIPCYDEPNILNTLICLNNCEPTNLETEVIIVINSSENTSESIVEQNDRTFDEVNDWIFSINNSKISYHVLNITDIPAKDAGVGFARKSGMNEAICRFNKINKPQGIIVSLDADTLCRPNYFVEIEKYYFKNSGANGANIYFEHNIDGEEFDSEIYNAITKYELYLRYYYQSLKIIGFPHYFHTIGSCFTVTAKAYTMQSGMNKKQAGEDFYFLQKIFSMGNYGEINSTCVYPSSRPSNRVPFGTGPTINKFIANEISDIHTYDNNAFKELIPLFENYHIFFKTNSPSEIIQKLPDTIKQFLLEINFEELIIEINKNCISIKSFKKKFFNTFNAFRVIKYLNFAHLKHYKKQSIIDVAKKLFLDLGVDNEKDFTETELLLKLRKFESQ